MESKAREDKPSPSEFECMVCNEDKQFVEDCFVFPCGSKDNFHEICKTCATKWFKKQATCPFCRGACTARAVATAAKKIVAKAAAAEEESKGEAAGKKRKRKEGADDARRAKLANVGGGDGALGAPILSW